MSVESKKILIDAQKCVMGDNDGIERYGVELLRHLARIVSQNNSEWEIDLYLGSIFVFNLLELHDFLVSEMNTDIPSAKFKLFLWQLRIRRLFANMLRTSPETLEETILSLKKTVTNFILRFIKPLDFSRYDLVHLLLPQTYEVIRRSKINAALVTAHDLSHLTFPRFHRKRNVYLAQKGFDFCVSHGVEFITVSESTRRHLLEAYPQSCPNKAHTVHEACDIRRFRKITDSERLARVWEKYGIPETPFLLTLSTLEPRKNLVNTIKAFRLLIKKWPQLDVHLVIAGKKGWKYEEIFKNDSLRSPRVVFTGFIADEDLPAIYSGATALSYISFFEGFGLPLLEAMSCGTPVIYGNNSSMPEIVGNAGLPAAPDDIEEICRQFRRIFENQVLRQKLSNEALKQAEKFSWEKCGRETMAVYSLIIEKAKEITTSVA